VTTVSLPGHDVAMPPSPSGSPLVVQGLAVAASNPDGETRTLVRDLSFRVDVGETLGLVGESGSGKSMTARAIVGLLPEGVRSSGSVAFGEAEIVGARERVLRRLRGSRVSLLLQDPFTMLNPLQTAADSVAESLPAAVRRDRRALRSEVERRLLEVGVDPARAGSRYPFQLSGGMRQRVALAAALAKDPELLIADEPTTALDVTTQREVLDLLGDLQQKRGMSLLLITHDLAVAFEVCDRVLVLYAGSPMECGPSETLVHRPAHPYTACLRRASPPASHFVQHLAAIPGNVPSADAVAGVCPFVDRCEWGLPICRSAHPPLRSVSDGHDSACVRSDEIRDRLRAEKEDAAPSQPVRRALPDDNGALLVVEGLRKSYRSVSLIGKAQTTEALRGVSFRIGSGEALGLVGESGSGKTSIARCILGLTSPSAGMVRVADVDVSDYRGLGRADLARVRRMVQIVFQDPFASLNPRLSVGTTLAEAVGARGRGVDVRAEVMDLLKLVGLPERYATRRPRQLSGGERQRVAIARAVAVRPQLLICDEPVASLDVSVQAQVLEVLRDVRRRRGTSMLFITHDLAVVRQMTERVIVLNDGEIVEEGDTDAVLDAPSHPYTRRLLDSLIA
jgi:oligopeptide/dipeptide ABC transporter ATP-binding protein